ncbi:hypothetical protein [Bradyrhizobium australiense]|uniref:Uncharacterized protein n=1 Tax=Bradyrhizobium australiense TaxID=2721161 RepID=A0A7Y4GSP8_9BRAD|nr:hypothetical protein [Bradyrhizobium australiense]NOJ41285.1 hypothetical protein [Bradyrhizobium australiense]
MTKNKIVRVFPRIEKYDTFPAGAEVRRPTRNVQICVRPGRRLARPIASDISRHLQPFLTMILKPAR